MKHFTRQSTDFSRRRKALNFNPPLTARDGGLDLAVCRTIDKAVFEMRVEISEACTKLADELNEPPLDDEP